MNGTLKSLLAAAALWGGSVFVWMVIVGIGAAAAGKGMGTALNLAMATAWGSALVIALFVVAVGKIVAWKWMPEGTGRIALLLALIVVQGGTFLMEAFSVFVIFNR